MKMLVIAIYIKIYEIPKLGMRGDSVMYKLLLNLMFFRLYWNVNEWITKTVKMHMVLR